MSIEEELIDLLLKRRGVCFSFFTSEAHQEREGVSVKICEEHDMAEYDVEFQPDTYLDCGPAKDLSVCEPTDLIFASYLEAGAWLSVAFGQRER